MKKLIFSLVLVFVFSLVRADEGMWLVHLLGDHVYNEMVKKGLKLSKDQLYHLNKPSIKDAIVIFGGGCTGAVVSSEGLIFTNHHCGYEAIASASTVENNYLKDGFWAKNKAEEIPSSSLSVQFLVRIEDVTLVIEEGIKGLSGTERTKKIQDISSDIVRKVTEGNNFEARVSSFFKNNQFLLFVYERYKDVRLVGTPPESIGKFGGDTDNWEWPRQTGDFSVFRVYMSKRGEGASYASDNIPIQPKYHLTISSKGIKEGDFSMTFGYPGSTNRYETSWGIKIKTEIENPSIVNLRDVRLKFMLNEMKKSEDVRLKLTSAYAGIANYWKFFDGESKQLLQNNFYNKKKIEEDNFMKWAKDRDEYKTLFIEYEKVFSDWWPYAKHRIYLNEGIMGSPLAAYVASWQALERALSKKEQTKEEINRIIASIDNSRKIFLSHEDKSSDLNIIASTCKMYFAEIVPSQHPPEFYERLRKAYGDLTDNNTFKKYAADIFANTMVFDERKWNAFITKPDLSTLQNDPAYYYTSSFVKNYVDRYASQSTTFNTKKGDLDRLYLNGVIEMNSGKPLYPDANFTMRVSYGNVKSYRPRENVLFDYACTMKSMLEKYKPGDYEFDLPKELLEAANRKDFGVYTDKIRNDLVVTFITTNDITGGNSGSPVLNGNGELIGLSFDSNYESLSHKISYDKEFNRTINVDVRYILWCIDKLGGAQNIIQELVIDAKLPEVKIVPVQHPEEKVAPETKRIALVIGVKSYQYVPPLMNTLNDARDMSATLKSKGFEVIELYDPKTKREMQDAIRKYFVLIQAHQNTAGLVFYSGHGMQVDGSNYLIPSQANPQIKADLDDQCLNMDYVMSAIQQAGNPLNIFILDACRNNPFRSFYRSNEQGLSMVNTPKGSYIVYSTKPGSVASDGSGRNGLFTSKLLKHLNSEGLNIEQVFKRVAADVSTESNDAQRPWIASDYTGDFYFTPR